MWIMLLLLPMALAMSLCFRLLKPKYRRVPAHAGWLFVLPILFLCAAWLIPFAPPTVLMLIVTALLSYLVIRAAMLLGLLGSFRAYDSKHSLRIPIGAPILAWGLTLLEAPAILTLLGLSYAIDFPAKMDVSGMAEVLFYVVLICTVGIALSFIYLGIMYSLRNQMSEFKPASLKPAQGLSDSKRRAIPAFKPKVAAQSSAKALPVSAQSKGKTKSF